MKAPETAADKIPPLERYQIFRNRIEHEDNLVMQRLSWLMASQSFLFTAYAIVTNGITTLFSTSGNVFTNHLTMLAQLIPIVALLNSFLIFLSIAGALKAIGELRCLYRAQQENFDAIPLQTSRAARTFGLSAPILLPLLFIAVWFYLLVKY